MVKLINMNKKISTPIAIGIILILSVVLIIFTYWQVREIDKSVKKIIEVRMSQKQEARDKTIFNQCLSIKESQESCLTDITFKEAKETIQDICFALFVSSLDFNKSCSYYCENIEDSLLRDYCYKKIATLSKETVFCNKINDEIIKKNCILRLDNKPEIKLERNKECLVNNDCISDCGSCVNKNDKSGFICNSCSISGCYMITRENNYSHYDTECLSFIYSINSSVNIETLRNDICNYLECSEAFFSMHGLYCVFNNEKGEIEDGIMQSSCECINNKCEKVEKCFSSKACLAAGTKITMADGSYKKIEDIKLGEIVKSFNLEKKELKNSEVIKVIKRKDPLIFINNNLKVAPDELIYLANRNTKMVVNLKMGDTLLSEGSNTITVYSVEYLDKLVDTYDLILENADNFFAEGYLVQTPK